MFLPNYENFPTHLTLFKCSYSCGPTVYDYAHIGNFRAFLTYDVLKRWLEYAGIFIHMFGVL
jgi:cysteinyl-tRNA synthetase